MELDIREGKNVFNKKKKMFETLERGQRRRMTSFINWRKNDSVPDSGCETFTRSHLSPFV